VTIGEALKWGRERLIPVAERPLLESELLLSHALGVERIFLHSHSNSPLEREGWERFREFVERRRAFEPVEYIMGEVSFFGERFSILPPVLIPRPETELLIEEVAKRLKGEERVAEVGIGSGVISITLKRLFPKLEIVATDIDPTAVSLARLNAERHRVTLEILEGSYLDGVEGEIDLIISNPPYIAEGTELPPSVALYESERALFGGREGDEVLKGLIDLFLEGSASMLACEMGYDQRERIEEYLSMRGFAGERLFYRDWAGWERGFILRK